MTVRRRDALLIGGVVALIYGLRAVPWDRIAGRGPRYVELAGLPPFRQLAEHGQTSSADIAFLGLDTVAAEAERRRSRAKAVRQELCTALFGAALPEGIVPIAYFSEFRCPYCRVLERDLDRLLAEDPATFRLIQHELPIFGPASELAARASVAAARQGRQQDLRRRFMRTPLFPNEASIQRVATEIDLDGEQLIRDMASPAVQAELDRSRALADIFGFIGTPGLVIGHTVLNGALPYPLLRRIASDEKSMPTPRCPDR